MENEYGRKERRKSFKGTECIHTWKKGSKRRINKIISF
jgi:hypothetical protein